jgi:hypothetical protein
MTETMQATEAEYVRLDTAEKYLARALAAEDRLAQIAGLAWSTEASTFRDDACRHRVAQPYADNRYVRLLDSLRDVVAPPEPPTHG